jgi:hypothetical protein
LVKEEEEEGTHTQKKKNGKNSRGLFFQFLRGSFNKKKRERLSDINYIGCCERYITPAIYTFKRVAENAYCKLACVFVC